MATHENIVHGFEIGNRYIISCMPVVHATFPLLYHTTLEHIWCTFFCFDILQLVHACGLLIATPE